MSQNQNSIIWTNEAKLDLTSILIFISHDRIENSYHILEAIHEKIDRLKKSPKLGRLVLELERFNIVTYRELILNPWRIIYKFIDKKIVILAVIDGRRNIEDILLNRFLRIL